MNTEEVLVAYNGKVLAIASFGDNKNIYVADFLGREKLVDRLYQLDCHEITLTDDGFRFITDYYTLDQVIDIIMSEINRGADFKYNTRLDLEKWLKSKGELVN
jgi:hypothetical protein